MSKKTPLKLLKSKHDFEVRCDRCRWFLGPGPKGWCESNDEAQVAFGVCLDFEPPTT